MLYYVCIQYELNFIAVKSVGPILGTARLKKDVVCKIKVFDSKWQTDQGIFYTFNYVPAQMLLMPTHIKSCWCIHFCFWWM